MDKRMGELNLDQLRERALGCRNCPLCEFRTNVVFGTGSPTAEILFVGEGPGKNEDEQGMPFVGRSGQLLDRMLAAIDLSRDKNIYIANMVKCRPPENRDPMPDEIEECIGYLQAQIDLIKPKIVVCLGRISAQRIISPDFKVTKQHGEFFKREGVYYMGTLHPSALLRNPRSKPETMEDFFKLRDLIKEVCTHTY